MFLLATKEEKILSKYQIPKVVAYASLECAFILPKLFETLKNLMSKKGNEPDSSKPQTYV